MPVLKKRALLGVAFLLLAAGAAWNGPPSIPRISAAEMEDMISTQKTPLLLFAMASWCAPCRKELPVLVGLHEKYRGHGLEIVGVSLDVHGPATMAPILDKAHVPFPFYWGGEAVAERYEMFGVPVLLFVKEGAVVERVVGERPPGFVEDRIRRLLELDSEETHGGE